MNDHEPQGLDISFQPDSSQLDENLRLLGALEHPLQHDDHMEYARRLQSVITEQAEVTGESHDAIRAASLAEHFAAWHDDDDITDAEALERVGRLSFSLGKVAMEPTVESLEDAVIRTRAQLKTSRDYAFRSETEKADLERELAQLREREQKLERLAYTDPVTGLANRHRLEAEYDAIRRNVISRGASEDRVLFLDVDKFKEVNDEYGQDQGDVVLRVIGENIRGHIREHDIVGRFGGDEFIIMLLDCSEEDSKRIAEDIRKTIEGMPLIPTTLSIGIDRIHPEIGTLGEAVTAAERKMKEAKREGRNRVLVVDDQPAEDRRNIAIPDNFSPPRHMRDN